MEKHNKKKLLLAIFGMLVFIAVGISVIAYSTYKTFYPLYQKTQMLKENNALFLKYINQSGKYEKEKNYSAELGVGRSALKYATSDIQKSQAYYVMAGASFYMKDYGNAKLYADKSVKLDPDYSYAYQILFQLSINDKDYEKALEYGKKFAKVKPNSDVAYGDLALVYYYLGNKDESVKSIKKAIELNPKEESYKEYLKKYEVKAVLVAPAPTLNPRELDPSYWKTELSYMNDDKGKLDVITGDAKYNQDKIAKEKIWLAQRINIINAIYAKLASGQKLNSSDLSSVDTYWSITDQYYALADEILAGK